MTAPKDITGPEDLAATVKHSTDPLEEHPNYGTAMNPPGDKSSRPDEISKFIQARAEAASKWTEATEHYIAASPIQSVAFAAAAGAAVAALLIVLISSLLDDR